MIRKRGGKDWLFAAPFLLMGGIAGWLVAAQFLSILGLM